MKVQELVDDPGPSNWANREIAPRRMQSGSSPRPYRVKSIRQSLPSQPPDHPLKNLQALLQSTLWVIQTPRDLYSFSLNSHPHRKLSRSNPRRLPSSRYKASSTRQSSLPQAITSRRKMMPYDDAHAEVSYSDNQAPPQHSPHLQQFSQPPDFRIEGDPQYYGSNSPHPHSLPSPHFAEYDTTSASSSYQSYELPHSSLPQDATGMSSSGLVLPSASPWFERKPVMNLNRRQSLTFQNPAPSGWSHHHQQPPWSANDVPQAPPDWPSPPPEGYSSPNGSIEAPFLSLPPISHFMHPPYSAEDPHQYAQDHGRPFFDDVSPFYRGPLPSQGVDHTMSELSVEQISSEGRHRSPSTVSSNGFSAQPVASTSRKEHAKKDRLSPNATSGVDKEGKYACQFCSKRFTRPSSLKIHMHSHTGERPFECPSCGRSFSVQSNLKRHQKIHQAKGDSNIQDDDDGQ